MIKPLLDNVAIQIAEAENVTASGIIIAETAEKEAPSQGKVLEIGKDVKGVKVGDMVIFSKYAANQVKIGESEFLIVPEKDILAILN